MPEAHDIYGVVFKNGTATLLGRIMGADGNAITQSTFPAAGLSSSGECGVTASYTLYLLDDQDPDSRTPVSGHENVAVAIADLIYDALQTDDIWTVDDEGYNFKHTLDICPDNAFAIAGRRYLVVFRLYPLDGDVIIARFRLNCI